jgi:hypothetical protein
MGFQNSDWGNVAASLQAPEVYTFGIDHQQFEIPCSPHVGSQD